MYVYIQCFLESYPYERDQYRGFENGGFVENPHIASSGFNQPIATVNPGPAFLVC